MVSQPKSRGERLQQLVARTGSFPLAVALRLLEGRGRQLTVLDPFVGKGTSLLAARLLGHTPLGLDVAPEAVVTASAKLVSADYMLLREYIRDLPISGSIDEPPEDVRLFYHPETLRQILAVRSALADDAARGGERRDLATFVTSCMLGIIHGRSSISLSVPSAHAYAMSPGYVRRYMQTHGLVAPRRDVRECLLAKTDRCWEALPETEHGWVVAEGQAQNAAILLPDWIGHVDVILTSPPYLDAQTYAKDNWLRHWFLGRDWRTLAPDYLQTGSVTKYQTAMARVFAEAARMLKPGGVFVCVTGDVRHSVRGTAVTIRTGEVLAELLTSHDLALDLEGTEKHVIPTYGRYFHELSKSNGHSDRPPLVERVFVARKSEQQSFEGDPDPRSGPSLEPASLTGRMLGARSPS